MKIKKELRKFKEKLFIMRWKSQLNIYEKIVYIIVKQLFYK